MMGHFGFSYVGLLYLAMLFIPNLLWAKLLPKNYTAGNEHKVLVFFERIGQVFVTCIALFFEDFNIQPLSSWSIWLILSFLIMLFYEGFWLRYFRGEHTLEDFYGSYLGIPVAGATLPVVAFFLLGIYGKVIWMILAIILLGIGHIGIHLQHVKEIKVKNDDH